MLITRALSFLLIPILSLVVSCTSMLHPIHAAPKKPIKQQFTVVIDAKMSGPERAIVVQSLRDWEYATDHLVNFVVDNKRWSSDDAPAVATDTDDEFEDDKCTDRVYIVRSMSDDPGILSIEKAIGGKIAGVTKSRCKSKEIDLVVDRFDTSEEFRLVTVHELGHLVGLAHIPVPHEAIMFPGESHAASCISKLDLKEFCLIANCDISQMHPCD